MADRSRDPRAEALAVYLRERASAFSLSADATGQHHIASAGMALLDAAALVERLPHDDPRLAALSRAGRFEAMPEGRSRFVETDDLRTVLQRPLSGGANSGAEILSLLMNSIVGD